MGTSESRFRDAVRVGDHTKAYELYYNKKIIRDAVDPQVKCFDDGSSLLHQAARHAMKPLYEGFLDKNMVNPLEKNAQDQSCIHLICSKNNDREIRLNMLQTTLIHQFVEQNKTQAVSCKDKKGNTPLHIACKFGLDACVDLLLSVGANATISNNDGQTPVDMATENGYIEIAKKLETQIVFAPSADSENIVIEMDPIHPPVIQQKGVALKNQEIQSIKDQLIIETSELLGVSLFTAEALLRNNGWSKEELLDSWMNDPSGTCEKAGVELPTILSLDNIDESLITPNVTGKNINKIREEEECSICCLPITENIIVPCNHMFCNDCWTQYLHDKITNGQVHGIVCPQFACYRLVPIHIVEKLVSRDMASKYLQYDIKAFVDSNPTIRWCPHPGCGQAVQKPHDEEHVLSPLTDQRTVDELSETTSSYMVHCGNDHYFCWNCGEFAHAPCTCKEWSDWLKKVQFMTKKIGGMSSSQVEEAASNQWISVNSKPCPNCNTSIEKTEGCNHMKCWKCKHGFCWMCLDKWSKHSSATGGYFECNRYKEREKVDDFLKKRQIECDEIEMIGHFKHYYERYNNHCHSLQLENKYLHSAGEKMIQLIASAGTQVGSVQFLEEAVRHLVEARHTLIASYGHGYFIMIRHVRNKFERLQGHFEEKVENLAEVVARQYLIRSKHEIIRLTQNVRDERLEFIEKIQKGLQSPQPSPIEPHLFDFFGHRRDLSPTPDYLYRRLEERQRQRDREREEHNRREEEMREEERQIQQALHVSTQQFHEASQLQTDTELAILLSMQDKDINELEERLSSMRAGVKPKNSSPMIREDDIEQVSFPHHSASQNSVDSSSLVLTTSTTPQQNDLERWRHTLIEREWPSSSSSSSSAHSNELSGHQYGMYGDEEDLQTAIALSLSEVPHQNNEPSNNPTNELTDEPQWNNLNTDEGGSQGLWVLPHPLRELLNSTQRPATNV